MGYGRTVAVTVHHNGLGEPHISSGAGVVCRRRVYGGTDGLGAGLQCTGGGGGSARRLLDGECRLAEHGEHVQQVPLPGTHGPGTRSAVGKTWAVVLELPKASLAAFIFLEIGLGPIVKIAMDSFFESFTC